MNEIVIFSDHAVNSGYAFLDGVMAWKDMFSWTVLLVAAYRMVVYSAGAQLLSMVYSAGSEDGFASIILVMKKRFIVSYSIVHRN
jgi:hypothetical protein